MDDKNLHRDVAHPITQEMRDYIHNKIIDAYKLEVEKGPAEPASAPEEIKPTSTTEEEKAPKPARGRFGRKSKPEAVSEPKEEEPVE